MKRLITGILLSVIAVLVCNSYGMYTYESEKESIQEEKSQYEAGAVIVKYKQEALDLSQYPDIEKKGNWTFSSVAGTYSIGYYQSAKRTTMELIGLLKQYDQVCYAEPNYEYRNLQLTDDTYANKQWYFSKDAENFGGVDTPDIAADYAWEKLDEIASEKTETVVAVIDTGVDYTHPDLMDRMWINTTTLPGVHGYDFINDDEDPMDDYGHGTHCAGIIAAQINNSVGIAGVSPNTKIMALKYMDESGGGLTAQAVAAYEYIIEAKKQGVNVVAVSNSWGTTDNPKALEDVIQTAGEMGIATVCAAGNFGTDQDVEKIFPAGYDLPYIVVVAASTPQDELASFSSYGKNVVDVAAPGTSILSCYYEDAYMPGINSDDRLFYHFEDDKQPFYGSNISVTDAEAFQGTHSLLWRTALAQDMETYDVSSTQTYINTLTFAIGASAPGEYFGFNFLVDGSSENGQYLYVDAYADYEWKNLTQISIHDINFWNSKYYLLPANTTRIRLVAINMSQGTKLYLDNIGIGTSTGKYAYLQGTSMAAPMVAGEISILARMFPEESVAKLCARAVGGVDHVMEPGLVVSDGRINLERAIMNPYPVMNSVSCDTEGELTINGYFFGTSNGTVTVNGIVARLISWNDTRVVVGYDQKYDGYTYLGLTRGDDNESSEQKLLLSNFEYQWTRETELPVEKASAAVAGCDDYIYVIGGMSGEEADVSSVYRYHTTDYTWEKIKELPKVTDNNRFQSGMSCVALNQQIVLYTTDQKEKKNYFYRYSIQDNLWSEMTFVQQPAYRSDAVLAVMNGFVYLVGGIGDNNSDDQENEAKKIWILNEDMSSWDVAANLLQTRYAPICGEIDGKLVITGGYSSDSKYLTSTEVFDGSAVIMAADIPLAGVNRYNTAFGGEEVFMVMTDGVSFTSPGVKYHLNSNTWTNSSYRLGYDKNILMGSTVVNGRLYCIGGRKNNRITSQVFSIPLIENISTARSPEAVREPDILPKETQSEQSGTKQWVIYFLVAAVVIVAGCGIAIYLCTIHKKD